MIVGQFGTNGANGAVMWTFGHHYHRVAVDWTKPGLRHLAFVYDAGTTGTRIYVDGVEDIKNPCAIGVQVPQIVTFGRLAFGNFPGFMDDLKIMALSWSKLNVNNDFIRQKESIPTVIVPMGINQVSEFDYYFSALKKSIDC